VTSFGFLPRTKRHSFRRQLIVSSVIGLTLILGLFGVFVRYVVTTTLINSVDQELLQRIRTTKHRPPPRPADQNQSPPGDPYDDPNTDPGQIRNGSDGFDGGQPDNQGPPPDDGGQQPGLPPQQPFQQGDDQFGSGPSADSRYVLPPNNLNVDDPYRPRRFTLDGEALDRTSANPAWDLAAIQSASRTKRPVFTTKRINNVDLRILTEQDMSPQGDTWYFQAPYPLTDVNSAIAGVDRALLTLIPIALLVAGIGGAFVTKSVVTRLAQLARTAGNIGANDLSQRLPVVGSDEFADLAQTFNALLTRVEVAFQEQAKVVEQQRRFTADASHELKTPLTIIRGTTSLALAGDGVLDRTATSDIDSAASSMSELVQDLIFLARSDAGQLGRKKIDILILDPLLRAIDRVAAISSAPIKLVSANESLVVNADESEMVRLFTNILTNAANHTPNNGRIIVSLSSSNTEVVIMVNDTGIGIAQQHIEHLGERFYRVDSARSRSTESTGGSGLGLAICRGIVEAHQGTISFESELGKGTTVTVVLPRTG